MMNFFTEYIAESEVFMASLPSVSRQDQLDTELKGRILYATFITLREHLSMEESLRLIDKLPLFIKGIYVNNWDYVRGGKDHIMNPDDLVNKVEKNLYKQDPRIGIAVDRRILERTVAGIITMINLWSRKTCLIRSGAICEKQQ